MPRFGPLVIWQGCLFLGVEASERLAAGAALTEMLHGHEILIGLVVQVAVAAAIVLLLGGAQRLGAVIANALKRPVVHGGRPARWRPSETQPQWRTVAGSAQPRAPPTLAAFTQPHHSGR